MSYSTILVGTDGSGNATVAVRTAAEVARRCDAEVHIACAHGDGVTKEEAPRILSEARGMVRELGARTKTHMQAGEPAPVLVRLAEVHGADVIVLGNEGMGARPRRVRLGSIAERVAHAGPCDVLIVHTRDRALPAGEYRRMLIGTDGSPTASEAVRKGVSLAEAIGAEVTLIHVGDPLVGAVVLEDAARDRPVPVRVRAEEGDAVDRIVEAAAEGETDLVVVGNRGMAGARRVFLASVPAAVSHRSPVDVLIAKTVGRSLEDLAPGHGGLVHVRGRRLAVYRADDGTLVALSPKCQHMGCTVDWNDADRTWDCPCHGSRYERDGRVITGPAKRDLDRVELPMQ